MQGLLDDIRSRVGGGEDDALPEKISAMAARFMAAEWTGAVQSQQIQEWQRRAEELESQLKALGALVEASSDEPDGVLSQLAERLTEYEQRRREQQGTIDRLTHSLAVRQVDEPLGVSDTGREVLPRLEAALEVLRRKGREPAGLWICIDQARDLRREHGSVVYDYVLVQVAERLKRALRQRDQLLRYDSDAFLLISEVAHIGEAKIQAARLAALIRKDPVSLGPKTIGVTISVAVTLAGKADDSSADGPEALVRRLQRLLDEAPEGTGRVLVDPTAGSDELAAPRA